MFHEEKREGFSKTAIGLTLANAYNPRFRASERLLFVTRPSHGGFVTYRLVGRERYE